VCDYRSRGSALENISFWDIVPQTVKEKIPQKKQDTDTLAEDSTEDDLGDTDITVLFRSIRMSHVTPDFWGPRQ
jgi:hypothetical protein